MSNSLVVSISSFYQIYCIPKKNLTRQISRWFSPSQIVESLNPLYEELLKNNPYKSQMGEIAIVGFNRFFDARIALALGLNTQLQEILVENISNNYGFAQDLLKNKVNCVHAQEILEKDRIDYFDQNQNFLLPMEQNAHYFVLPVFVISTNDQISPASFFLQPLQNNQVYQEISKKLGATPVSRLVKSQINEDGIILGITETDPMASSFLRKAKDLMK